MIESRIERFLTSGRSDEFERLALEVFEYQYRKISSYRRLCDRRDATPERIQRWQDVPVVPASAFKSLRLSTDTPRETFRSSGTTEGARRSVHGHPFPDLYRRVIDASFPVFCLPDLDAPPMLSLIPSRRQLPDSSLSFMIDHVLETFGGSQSVTAFGEHGVELDASRAWLEKRVADRRPVMVLATALALVQCLESLDATDTSLPLPAGSVVFETGGFKGRQREIARSALLTMCERRLGVPPERVVREYGMTELTSQAYSPVLIGGDQDVLVTPDWLRVRILDPVTLEEAADGEVGLITLFDLANVGSVAHLMTEDLGVREPDDTGFRLLGRAAGAELRGCSLTVEELADSL